ncbi:MAG TPA: AtpZ/AtpI family protein [Candidatus Pacearchaeota archaeon]|nr:AtpZ/AtpI family protein [Candidatus Pacearchaeota archaeon]
MAKNLNTLHLGLKIGLLVSIPLIGFLLLGVWIDTKFNTFPIYLIAGIVVGLASAVFLVYKVIIPYINKKVNNNKDNNK